MKYLYLLFAIAIAANTQAKEAYIENKGQIIDQNRIPNPSVLYLYNGKGLNVQLRKTGFSYDVWKQNDSTTTTYNRVDIEFVNRSAAMRTTTAGKSNDYLNYYTEYTGANGVTHVHHYHTVTYQNVWNGIDLQFVLNGDKPKYNFIIHAGGKLSDIKLDIKGANKIAITNNNLLLETNLSVIEEAVPQSYYNLNEYKTIVHAGFIKNADGSYGLNVVENIPVNAELVIDPVPVINWGTLYGGSAEDRAFQAVADYSGNAYLTGRTRSTNAIATTGAFQTSYSASDDGLLAKMDNTGNRLWGTYYGGSGYDDGVALTIESNDKNVFICGYTISSSVFGTPGAFKMNFTGTGPDGFLSSFDSTGVRQWSTYFGTLSADQIYCLALDTADNIYIAGITGGNGLASTGAFQPTKSSGNDGFVAKFSKTGSNLWSTYYGGNYEDYVLRICIYGNSLYTAGCTRSTNIATTGAYKTGNSGVEDAYIGKFNLNGNRIWSTFLGAANSDCAYSIVADNTGIYTGGYTQSSTGMSTPGAHQTTFGGGLQKDGFLAKINHDGNALLWSTYYGGQNEDYIIDMTCDKLGQVIICGSTNSPNNISTPGTLFPTYPWGYIGFVSKFDSLGNRAWGSYYESASSVFVDDFNYLYISGWTANTSICTPGTYQTTLGGGVIDAFLAKYGICDTGFATASADSPIYKGSDIHLIATGGGTYMWSGPNGFTSISSSPTKTNAQINDTGIYTVTVTDPGGCIDTVSIYIGKILDTTNHISDIIPLATFSLYPNPTTGLAQIDINLKHQQKLSVAITDITGRTVYTTNENTYHTGKGKIELNVSSLPGGTYICRLQNEHGNTVWSGKMAKE